MNAILLIAFLAGQQQAPPVIPKPQQAPPVKATIAYIELTLPASAEVWFDGVKTKSTGTVRKYETPELAEPSNYTVKVVDGTRLEIRHITVWPGETTRAAFFGKAVSLSALPFLGEAISAVRDGNAIDARVASSVPALLTMERYQRAKFSQRIYTMGGFRNHYIDPVDRSTLDEWTRIPGGLEKVTGWSSVLYRRVPSVKSWIGDIGVRNRFGDIQTNRGWKREYGNGSMFAEVLSTPRGVFEVRVARKDDGRWSRKVEYRNRMTAPAGYVGAPACATCHNADSGPGTGSYEGGLVPGGETIFSDPFDELG